MITTLLIDGHVHYHACFGVAPFLEAAADNFRAARREIGEPDAIGCLMLSENSWVHAFRAFSDRLIGQEAAGWCVEETSDGCSLVVARDPQAPILIVAGRQVVTAERLEVLALATLREFPDGLPFRTAVESVVSSGAVPVLPWGFGKWTGARGRTVRELIASPQADAVYVGDNGGRPGHLPAPALFRLAKAQGVPILPGSDPLPLPAEAGKPGRFGFVLRGAVDLQAPAESIRSLLADRRQPQPFGRLESPGTFVLRQAQLRLRRRETPAWPLPADVGTGRP